MKNFQDFIDTLNSETVDTIIASVNASGAAEERKQFMIALKLLNLYHDWLHDSYSNQQNV